MTEETPLVHTVVKVGGGLLGKAGALDLVIEALTAFRAGRRLVVLPGGGPFADAVREMFKRVKIGDDAAPTPRVPVGRDVLPERDVELPEIGHGDDEMLHAVRERA